MTKMEKKQIHDRSVLDSLEPGFYILTQYVENPRVDRRVTTSEILANHIIEAGIRFQARHYPIYEPDAITQKGHRVELLCYGSYFPVPASEDWPLAQIIAPLLEKADPALGHYLNNSSHEPRAILAVLFEKGKITFDDLKDVHEYIKQQEAQDPSGDLWAEWILSHWIDRLSS